MQVVTKSRRNSLSTVTSKADLTKKSGNSHPFSISPGSASEEDNHKSLKRALSGTADYLMSKHLPIGPQCPRASLQLGEGVLSHIPDFSTMQAGQKCDILN